MIWTIVSRDEMENYNIPPVFQYYREVIGKEYIRMAILEPDEPMDFIKPEDVVLLRSADRSIVNNILARNIRTTAEDFCKYEIVSDKKNIHKHLPGVLLPDNYSLNEIDDERTYFVKPRFGSESFGIDEESICTSPDQVQRKVDFIKKFLKQEALIEEYIDGVDCTVACLYNHYTGDVETYPIMIETKIRGGIQTHNSKFEYMEYCSAIKGDNSVKLGSISKNVFNQLKLKHHARIDFRLSKDGIFYLIDVNLIPGLGPSAHFSKCLLLCKNMSYSDVIKAVICTAS